MTDEKLDPDFADLPLAARAEIEVLSGIGLHHAPAAGEEQVEHGAMASGGRSSEPSDRGGPVSIFIAMNRFQVIPGEEAAFEDIWLSRDSHLAGVPGFVEFHMLRGPAAEDHVLYSSHTVWRSRGDFEAWTRSEAFRAAHRGAGGHKPLYLGPPRFEGFDVIQTVTSA